MNLTISHFNEGIHNFHPNGTYIGFTNAAAIIDEHRSRDFLSLSFYQYNVRISGIQQNTDHTHVYMQ